MSSSRVKIVTYVPEDHADAIRQALGDAGAGTIGEYTFNSYTVRGTGRWLPSDKAHPFQGTAGKLEIDDSEERVEVTCDRSEAKEVIALAKKAHPYEEPVFDIYQLLTGEEL